MNKTKNWATGIAVACLFLTSKPVAANPLEQQVDEVVSHLVGLMDTSAQAAANPDAPNVRITTCKVSLTGETDAVYLYQEQALSKSLNQPYRQRFLRIAPGADGNMVESQSYKPAAPEALTGLCNKPEADRGVQTSDLGEAVCSVFLKPVHDIYIGTTQPGGCPANVRGATKITNTIILRSTGMDTWDRGYDADGNQVWGAETDSYQFRWLEP